MRPILFEIGGISFSGYRVMLTVAFLLCTFLVVRESDRRQPGFRLSPTIGIWAFIGALFGAKLFYQIQYAGWAEAWRAVLLWQGGLVYYGGLFGGLAAVLLGLRLQRAPIVKTLDIAAVYLPLGQALARLGCFLNGCCYGKDTGLPWGVRFPPGSDAYMDHLREGLINANAASTPSLHPAQLYTGAGLIVVFLILRIALQRRQRPGVVVSGYLVAYGVLRFTVEFVRGDNEAFLLGLSLYQHVSILLAVIGLAGILVLPEERAAAGHEEPEN